eukprot:gene4825-8411_t
MSSKVPSFEGVKEAYERIKSIVHKTPILTCESLNEIASENCCNKRKLFFKCENFQKVGAFKFRGACNAVFSLSDEDSKKGVITHSSGNFAQALSLAAKIKCIPAHIIMPSNSPSVKKNAVQDSYKGIVYECSPDVNDREILCKKIQKETGSIMLHSYNHIDIIHGQGTIAVELMEQMGSNGKYNFDTLLSPIGGGGLMSGLCVGLHGFDDSINIYGAEPKDGDDAKRSLESNKLIKNEKTPNTIADGLLTNLGSLTWPIIQKHVKDIFTVSDDEILKAMKLVYERMKIVIEPSSAVAIAVVLWNEKFKKIKEVKDIVIVISGGNVDLSKISFK